LGSIFDDPERLTVEMLVRFGLQALNLDTGTGFVNGPHQQWKTTTIKAIAVIDKIPRLCRLAFLQFANVIVHGDRLCFRVLSNNGAIEINARPEDGCPLFEGQVAFFGWHFGFVFRATRRFVLVVRQDGRRARARGGADGLFVRGACYRARALAMIVAVVCFGPAHGGGS